MDKKICVVTGATTGIGRETALGLAKQGATVILVARDKSKGDATVADIRTQTGNEKLDLFLADLSSQAEIRRLAAELTAKYPKLNVLVNNAGGVFMERKLTVDGLEYTFGFNHLGYFLLTHLLLDALKAGAPARIVNVSSDAHRPGRIVFDDLQGEKNYSGFGAYCSSKLANVLFSNELARRLRGTGVTVNSLHPGVVSTGFARNNGWFFNALVSVGSLFMLTAEQGAQTSIYLASSPEVEGVSGKYFDKSKAVVPSADALNEADAKRLWEVSEKLVGLAG